MMIVFVAVLASLLEIIDTSIVNMALPTMMGNLGATLEDIDYCVHPHPAITEGVQECARLLLGRGLLKTRAFETTEIRCIEG